MQLVSLEVNNNSELGTYEESPYGHGTCLRLNPEQCKALGVLGAPPAGFVYMISARAVVERVTEEADVDDKSEGNEVYLELRITDMSLDSQQTRVDHASRLYPA